MEGWDLQAVVRGCTNNIDAVRITNTMKCSQAPSSSCFALSNIQEDHYLFHAFDPQLFEATTTALDELEDLYKPFYPVFQYPISSPPTILTSSISLPKEFTEVAPKKLKNMKESSPMCKKSSRKSQNKRVVKEVKAEELFSDVWAWRKYGQKPIKGSPYPRSYYRCSSSKGCSARKQVERSCSNPETFVITYTAEHNHVHPTRRNSLAGSTRSKFPTAPKTKDEPCLNSPAIVPLVASIADESSHEIIKEEAKLLEEDENVMLDMMLSDNTNFPNLEELDACELSSSELPVMDGWFLDQFSDNFPSPWFNIGHSTSTVTGAC